jgi:prepilin-type N-terminal cleavage/methylation domain-containing protein
MTEDRRQKTNSGFTLIEAVITLVVLSIAAVGVLSVFTVGSKGSANPLLVNQAIGLAQGEMEQVLGEKMAPGGFAAIGTGAGIPCVSTILNCNRTIYYVNPGALNTQVGGPTNYKHVTVTITQPTIGSVSVESIVTNY